MLMGSSDIEAADDREATRIAREQGDGQVVEVWNADRRVRILAPLKAVAPDRLRAISS